VYKLYGLGVRAFA